MHIVSKKRWVTSAAGLADYSERIVACEDHPTLLSALSGYRLRRAQDPIDPTLIFGLFDLSRPQWPVVLIGCDGYSESVSIQSLH